MKLKHRKLLHIFLLASVLLILFSLAACKKQVPAMDTVAEKGAEWAYKELRNYALSDFTTAWGQPDDSWSTEDNDPSHPDGYLWLLDDEGSAIILYFDDQDTFKTISISLTVTDPNHVAISHG